MARPAINGVRRHVMLTNQQLASLERYSKKTGLTITEQIRRAIDMYLASAAEKLSRKP